MRHATPPYAVQKRQQRLRANRLSPETVPAGGQRQTASAAIQCEGWEDTQSTRPQAHSRRLASGCSWLDWMHAQPR